MNLWSNAIELMFIASSMSLSMWWCSTSPSILLVALLLLSSMGGGIIALCMGLKIQAYLMILTIVGGLFISISFVILAYPADYETIKPSVIWGSFVSLMVFLFIKVPHFFSNFNLMNESEGFSSQIQGLSSLSLIFLLLFMLISLKLIDSMLYPEGGGMFPK